MLKLAGNKAARMHIWLRMLSTAGRMGNLRGTSPERSDLVTDMCDLRAMLFMARGWEPEHLNGDGFPGEYETCQLCNRIFPFLYHRIDGRDHYEIDVCEECADTADVYCSGPVDA